MALGAAWRTQAVVSLLLAIRLAAALFVVPPWQQPDEPQHVLLVRFFVLHPDGDRAALDSRELEAEIAASMHAHLWWAHLGRPQPPVPPTSFLDGPGQAAAVWGVPDGPQRYHRVLATLLRGAGIHAAEGVLRAMRTASATFAVLAVLLATWASMRLLGAWPAATVGGCMALHPQFLLVASSATPDAFTALMMTVVWTAAALAISGRTSFAWAVAAVACGIAAFLVRRLGVPTLLLGCATAAGIGLHRVRDSRALVAAGGVFGLCGLAAMSLATAEGRIAFDYAWRLLFPEDGTSAANAPGLVDFTRGLFRSYWLAAGWLTYPAPDWFYTSAGLLTFALLTGALVTYPSQHEHHGRQMLAALAFIASQSAAVFAGFYVNGYSAQGRYLVPALAPMAWLVPLAFASGRGRARRTLTVLVVAACAGLGTFGLLGVLVPAYLP